MPSKKKDLKSHKLKGNKKNKGKAERNRSEKSCLPDPLAIFDLLDLAHNGLPPASALPAEYPPGIEVKDCGYGRGVFVTQMFEPEEIVGEVSGEIIKTKGYGSQNCMDIGKHGVLEPAPPFQYLNHSCQPNCELVWEVSKDKKKGKKRPRVFVQSIRPIAPGEQLTLDYAWPANDAIPCQCESEACRGWVVAEEELHLVPNSLAV